MTPVADCRRLHLLRCHLSLTVLHFWSCHSTWRPDVHFSDAHTSAISQQELYPLLEPALTRKSPALLDPWRAFIYMAHAVLDPQSAWEELQAITAFMNPNVSADVPLLCIVISAGLLLMCDTTCDVSVHCSRHLGSMSKALNVVTNALHRASMDHSTCLSLTSCLIAFTLLAARHGYRPLHSRSSEG